MTLLFVSSLSCRLEVFAVLLENRGNPLNITIASNEGSGRLHENRYAHAGHFMKNGQGIFSFTGDLFQNRGCCPSSVPNCASTFSAIGQ